MLVVTLGTHASGSTWLYNVVRALFESAGRPIVCASADDGMQALDQLPVGADDVIIKCHGMDQRLLKLTRIADAKVIVTTRDARDSVVSQRQRFGLSLHQAVRDISRPLATIASLPVNQNRLHLVYEDRFMDRIDTIAEIAGYLEIPCNEYVAKKVYQSLRPSAVRRWIAARAIARSTKIDSGHDPVTQWHSTHIGDGLSGKWQRELDAASQSIVSECLCAMSSPGIWQAEPIRWSPTLFWNKGSSTSPFRVTLEPASAPDFLSYGPYLCIPRGRWRAVAQLAAVNSSDLCVEADVYSPHDQRVLACSRTNVTAAKHDAISLTFDHHDQYQPLETRLRAVEHDGGPAMFAGWHLYWLGPI